jgi:hypothetical protein
MFGFRSEKRGAFERVAGSEDHEQLLDDNERSSLDSHALRPIARGPSGLTTAIALICTAILSALLGALAAQFDRLDSDTFSIRHTSQYCMMENFLEVPQAILKKFSANYQACWCDI